MLERKCVRCYRLVQHCSGVTRFKQVENQSCNHALRKRTRCQCMRGSGNSLALQLQIRGLQRFLSEGHIRYYTLVRGPDFLRRVIVSGKVAFHQFTNFQLSIYYFFITDKVASRVGWMEWLRGPHLASGPQFEDPCYRLKASHHFAHRLDATNSCERNKNQTMQDITEILHDLTASITTTLSN